MMYRKTNHKSRDGAIRPADRLLFLIALAALGVTLIVRLATGAGSKIDIPPPPDPLRLVISVGAESGLGTADLEALAAEYLRTTDITIEVVTGDPNADIQIAETQTLAREIAEGRYLALDPYVNSESALEKWALPLVSSMDVLIYNIPLLREAGFDRPPRTRTEFLRYAQTITGKENGPAGLSLGLSSADSRGIRRDIFSWIWASGLSLFNEGKPEFTGRGLTAALEFFSQLNREGLLAPGTFTATGAQRVAEFIRGQSAMMIVPVRDLRLIRERMEDVGITLVPPGDDYFGRPVFGLSTWYAGIGAASPHPDEAWDLLRFLQEHRSRLAEALTLVPGVGDTAAYIAMDPLLDKAWDMYEAADTIQEFLGHPEAEELERSFRRELEIMFRDSRSAEETAAAIRERWARE